MCIRDRSKLVELSKMDIEETEPAVRTALNKYGRDFLPLWHELMMAVIQASEDITGISNPAKVKHLLTLKRLATDILARGDCFTIKAVSYTHLDVYKRQVHIQYAKKSTSQQAAYMTHLQLL